MKKVNHQKIFIGMPVFNGQKFLKIAIESVLAQSYKNFILYISDNNSTDDTEKIIQFYKNIDSRIIYFKQKKNIGSTSNFLFLKNKNA